MFICQEIFHNDKKNILYRLKNSEYELFLNDLRKCKNAELSTGVANLTTYITININEIDDKKYKDQILGSGTIESGNKCFTKKDADERE